MTEDQKPHKKPQAPQTRDAIIRTINKQIGQDKKPSPMVTLKEIFEEAADKDRFVGDTMFWKYFEDIDIDRVYHTTSVEYRNLKVMCRETFFYTLLLLLFTFYVYQLQSPDVFQARANEEKYWSGCDSLGRCSLNRVENVSSFWNWMQDDFVKQAFTEYTEPVPDVADIEEKFSKSQFPLTWHPRFVGPQMGSVILGSIRLRQLRVEKNMGCEVSKLYSHIYPDCFATYNPQTASTWTYSHRFVPTYLKPAYQHSSATETLQPGMPGKLGVYGGDGFKVELPFNKTDAESMISDLWRWNWVDRSTRLVVIEVSTLNINVNVIANNRILVEFGPTGSVVTSVRTNAAQVFQFTPNADTSLTVLILQFVLLVCFMLFLVWTLWLMYKTCLNFLGGDPIAYLKQQSLIGKFGVLFTTLYAYLSYGWNCVDMVILGTFFSHIGLRFSTYTGIMSLPTLAPDVIGHPELFMPFSMVIENLALSNNMLALTAMIMWVKLYKYLCMSSYFRMLVRILERCAARLCVFSVLLLVFFFGFAVAFFVGMGGNDGNFSTIAGSFLVLFFLLLDGFKVEDSWFEPGRDWLIPLIFFIFIAIVYFVIMNLFVAVVLDVYATSGASDVVGTRKNPMSEFLYTYYKFMLGISLVRDDTEENLRSEDLSIPLQLLPGLVRRKWVEKKRHMQLVAREAFAGMELYPGEEEMLATMDDVAVSDWTLPSSKSDVYDSMDSGAYHKAFSIYEIPREMLHSEVSRAQLQRLMDEDPTLPMLLRAEKAVDVIRRFKGTSDEQTQFSADVPPVKALQGQVFGQIDNLEKVKLDEDIPEVPEITEITEDMSAAITDVRNQFRLQLTSIIEATATLFEHLVDLTQAIDQVRENHLHVMENVRENS
jgi:hypothetical protein